MARTKKIKKKKEKLSRKEAKIGILFGVCVGLASWHFDWTVGSFPPEFAAPFFGIFVPILCLLKQEPRRPVENPPNINPTQTPIIEVQSNLNSPTPVRKPKGPPLLSEPPIDAARRLGIPAILLQPHHPLLSRCETTSWFGGFPILPDHIEWPRENYGIRHPLHFMAQINCAELPARAVEAHGFPRTGYLCFFSEIYEIGDGGGAVIHFEDDITHLSPRKPPEDSLPIFGHEDYTTPFSHTALPVDRSGLPHPSSMPRVPVEPIEFISYPGFGHMFMTSPLYQRPKFKGNEASTLSRALEAQRTEPLADTVSYDLNTARVAYKNLVAGPTDIHHTSNLQYTGLVKALVQTLAEDANRYARYGSVANKQRQCERIHVLGSNFANELDKQPFFQKLDARGLSKLRDMKASWLDLREKRESFPDLYFRKVERHLQHFLFNALVNPETALIPEEVRPALLKFQSPEGRGIFQMGGYFAGCQHSAHPTKKWKPLLSVGYCELTGFKYGDNGDWHFEANTEDLQRKTFSNIRFSADSC